MVEINTQKSQASRLDQAESLYIQKEYDSATDLYIELLDEMPENPYLKVNLANSFFQQKNYGEALYYYYTAKSAIPRSKELKDNLEMAVNKIELSQPPLFSYHYMTFSEAFLVFLIFNVLFLVRGLFKRRAFVKFLLVLLFIVSGANFAFITYEQKVQEYAVVNSISTKAYSGDNEAYSELFELLDGQIVQVLHKQDTWSKLKFNDSIAWVKNKDLRFL